MGWKRDWQILTSHSHGGWKSKIRELACLGPGESPLSGRCLLVLASHRREIGERVGWGERERERKCVGKILDKNMPK